jgi:hypothetical protein
VATVAVLTLLLGASIDRLPPLPAGLVLPSEVVHQQLPFRGVKPIVNVPADRGAAGIKTSVIEPDAPASAGPNEQTFVADQPTGMSSPLESARKAIVNPNPDRSIHESEADIVAQDTVVRYDPRSTAPRTLLQEKR